MFISSPVPTKYPSGSSHLTVRASPAPKIPL